MTHETPDTPTTVHVPAPTTWPLILGFGITFMFAGIVTHWMVTATGAVLALFGVVGLFRDVLPHEKEIELPVTAPAAPPPAEPGETPAIGRDQHRMRIPVEIHPYSAGIRGGLLGGVAMAIIALIWGLFQGSIWYPINLLAAMGMTGLTEGTVDDLRGFHLGALAVALLVHVIMSVLVGLVYAVILPMLPRRPVLMGGIIAPILWTALLWSTMRLLNPALNEHVSWPWFLVSQIAYGVTVGRVIASSERIKTLQSSPLVERAGVEMTGRIRR